MPELSSRLQVLLDLLQPCSALADIGTDHGYIPLYAIAQGLVEKAYGCDLNAAPLIEAKRNLARSGLGAQVEFCHGDGLAALSGRRVDALIFAGMNGELMSRLLHEGAEVLKQVDQVVVQPNQGIHLLRFFFAEYGFHLKEEVIQQLRGRFFISARFERASGADPIYDSLGVSREDALHLGPDLIRKRNSLARSYYLQQEARHEKWSAHNPSEHEPALARVRRVLALFQSS